MVRPIAVLLALVLTTGKVSAQDEAGAEDTVTETPPSIDAPSIDAPSTETLPSIDAPSTETDTSDTDALVIPELAIIEAAPDVRRELASPRIDRARAARALRNVAFATEALARERGSADLEFAVAVNLYVGGVLLSVLSASLIIGTLFEAACINGDISECTDGPAFLIGAIPATIAAAALLFGAATTDQRAQAHYRSLERRGRDVEDRRRLLAPSASVSVGPASIAITGRF